MNYLFKIFKK